MYSNTRPRSPETRPRPPKQAEIPKGRNHYDSAKHTNEFALIKRGCVIFCHFFPRSSPADNSPTVPLWLCRKATRIRQTFYAATVQSTK
ncbi:hypothetical protein LSAT2_032476 [Lamellibrachia satsuma]|nr:hypothetical protein LSAT2_032476 [Lamellibrachia satsuma]